MTDIVTPPLIDELPAAPLPTDSEEEHDSKAYAMVGAMVAMVPQINASATATMQNALAAKERAQNAASAAASAAAVQDALWGATNFKGFWSELAGPLSKPATVKHEGRLWLLLETLTDVTAAEPGVSPAWTALDAGQRPQQEVASGVVACIPGVLYVITGASVTLTAPTTGLQQGDYFGFRLAAPVSGTQVVDFGDIDVRAQSAGARYIDKPAFGLDLQFNSTKGWV